MTDNQIEPVLGEYNGVAITQLPHDLYVPPDALEVYLETFHGPLDLLLYLIRKNNVDILNIPIAEITRQYLTYVEAMKALHLELAAEYLVMAATLAEIKSRLLLPRHEESSEEADPRAELIRRLQEYERIKAAAEDLEAMPRLGRDTFSVTLALPQVAPKKSAPMVMAMPDLLEAFLAVLKRSDMMATHKVAKETLSVRERMSHVLELINREKFIPFQACFNVEEGRMGVVVSFLALLELLRLKFIDMVQSEPFAPIYLKANEEDETDVSLGEPEQALETVEEYDNTVE